MKSKIKNLKRLIAIVSNLKKQGRKIIFTNGCFDILHYGHVRYLEDARKKGDILVVGVNSDASVRRIKGSRRPLVNENDRIGIIAALESVDYAVLFYEDTPYKLIKALKPDVLVKGADWNADNIVGKDIVRSYGGKAATVKLLKGRSTTSIINKISRLYRCQ